MDNINILLIGLFGALATGGAVVAGHYLGQGNEENACKAANQVVLFVTRLSIPVIDLYNGCTALFHSMGNSTVTKWISVIMNVIHAKCHSR